MKVVLVSSILFMICFLSACQEDSAKPVPENNLIEAKTQSLKSAQRIEELYANALNAMRNYSGQGDSDDY